LGKFDDALKKARAARGKPAAKPVSSKVVKMPREEIDNLRLETEEQIAPEPRRTAFNGRIDPRLACLQDPSSAAAECFKTLRSKIMVGQSGKLCRTIMVTGAQPLDGKSMVSANLAVSIAQGINHHVLLVDCDLRRPSLHKTFGLQAGQGLREYLEKGTSIAPYLLKTPVSKLTLLPAGTPIASPSELLGSEKMQSLIKEVRDRYKDRFIIFDTPPAHFIADTALLADLIDGVVLVVRSGKTDAEFVRDVVENIGKENILGVVFNATNEAIREYRYYYKYYQRGKA
jgi:exopolysaccharide/PEP-CTERM locus tyrosine autokinase